VSDPDPEDPIDPTRMTLGEHLEELRTRLFKGLLAVGIAFVLAFSFDETIAAWITAPLERTIERLNEEEADVWEAYLAEHPDEERSTYFTSDDPADRTLREDYRAADRPITTGAGEEFFFVLKICVFFALVVGSPVLLWQLWQFIAAGLYAREKKALLQYFPYAVALLVTGIAFGYFVMLPWAMFFLSSTLGPDLSVWRPKLSEYLSLTGMLTLALGVVFQLPILMHAVISLGIIEREVFVKYRPHFVVVAFIFAALLTPPDPFTQAMMAGPMVVLFEIGLLATRRTRHGELRRAG